jgi:hypothetical protein
MKIALQRGVNKKSFKQKLYEKTIIPTGTGDHSLQIAK